MSPLLAPLPASPVEIGTIEVFVLRAPIETPVRTSFGVMRDRPAVFVRVEDVDGVVGWGEIWCNFPACGAEHRARLVDSVLAPRLAGGKFDSPMDVFRHLSQHTAVLAIQSGEAGPFAQAIAGIDIALWDLCARRARQPLWRYLSGQCGKTRVYASGISPDDCVEMAIRKQSEGYRAFKLKVGFGEQRDLRNVQAMRVALGSSAALMVDANQGWDLDTASRMASRLEPFGLQWLEEPLRADSAWDAWLELARTTRVPLAAGENIVGECAFTAAMDSGALSVVQPDIAKWGGISGNWAVVDRIGQAGLRYYPHYLGGGIGLLASGHLLAASGGEGALEIDSNANPLRTRLSLALNTIDEGWADLGDKPGLGVTPNLTELCEVARRTH